MRIQAENRAYRIGEVMALSDTAYYAYRRELQNRPPAEGNRREPEGGRTFLLAMGEDGEDIKCQDKMYKKYGIRMYINLLVECGFATGKIFLIL